MLCYIILHYIRDELLHTRKYSRPLATTTGRTYKQAVYAKLHSLASLGDKVAHQKSTPRKSPWIFRGIFQWMFSGIFQRIVTSPLDVHWKCTMDLQWHCPTEFHVCDLCRVIVCPDTNTYANTNAADNNDADTNTDI